jgi:hypothetical protein
MIRTLYYDTAITGRFHYKEPNDSRAQPHLCRLALLIEDGDEELATHSMLIKPLERWTFDPEAIQRPPHHAGARPRAWHCLGRRMVTFYQRT